MGIPIICNLYVEFVHHQRIESSECVIVIISSGPFNLWHAARMDSIHANAMMPLLVDLYGCQECLPSPTTSHRLPRLAACYLKGVPKVFHIHRAEATCRNLQFCSILPALGSAAATIYCQLTGLTWARRRLSAWHGRLCAGSSKTAVRFGSLSSWACSWQVLAKRQCKAMQLSAEHIYMYLSRNSCFLAACAQA